MIEYITQQFIAEALGVRPSAIANWHARGVYDMPEPDAIVRLHGEVKRLWLPARISEWKAWHERRKKAIGAP